MARFRPSNRVCLRLFLAALFVAAAAEYVWNALDNFHAVKPGQLYRSGQLSAAHLLAHVQVNGIRTIVNLRGPNPGEEWYKEEIAAAQRAGLIHIDLPIDSGFPTTDELRELMQVIETCPKPMLLHCQSGIDRTGTASALACLLLDENCTPKLAFGQIDWKYGCLPRNKSRQNNRDFLSDYEAWLSSQNLTHSREHFHVWLRHVTQINSPPTKNWP